MYKGIVNESSSRNIEVKNSKILLDGEEISLDVHALSPAQFHVLHAQRSYRVEVIDTDYTQKKFVFTINGKQVSVQLKEELDLILEKMGMEAATETAIKEVRSPMPGLIRDIAVTEGASVSTGDKLLTLEAMKMENAIKSPVDGNIASIQIKTGQSVEKNQLLITFE